ncbi:MAG: hypothetical protein R3B13_20350 [Polyangiaceae bacterium]
MATACGSTSEDAAARDAGQDRAEEAATTCPSLNAPRPQEGSPCGNPGLECDTGTLSCWVKLTCGADSAWHVTCGHGFPDGGPCC